MNRSNCLIGEHDARPAKRTWHCFWTALLLALAPWPA